MPILLIGFVLLFILPTLLKKKNSSATASTSTQSAQTIEAMNLIDKGEQRYFSAHGRFTPHLADLLTPRLATDLAIGLGVQLDVGTGGQNYLAQVQSDVLSLVRARNNTKLTAQSCLVVKSGSGVHCPTSSK